MLKFLATTENTKIITSEEPIYSRGKMVKKSSGKLLFAISRHGNTREQSCLVGNRRQSDYEETNQKWTRVNLRWKGRHSNFPNGLAPKLVSQVKTHSSSKDLLI